MTQLIQSVLTMLRGWEWMPVTAARVLIGIFFCISGGTKLFVKAQFGVLMGDMIVAAATNRIHSIQATGVIAWLDDFLYLPEVLYTLILFWLIFSGPGRYSVDGLIASRLSLVGVER
jgi:putative oxidoreductase